MDESQRDGAAIRSDGGNNEAARGLAVLGLPRQSSVEHSGSKAHPNEKEAVTDAEQIVELKRRLQVAEEELEVGIPVGWVTEEEIEEVVALRRDLLSDLEDIPRGILTLEQVVRRDRDRAANTRYP